MSRACGIATIEDGIWICREPSGRVVCTLSEGDIYSPGSSIGGWVCTDVVAGRGARLVRVSGPQKAAWRNGERPRLEGEAEWLKLGPVRLATSAGAAQRGLTHRDSAPSCPIEAWRLKHRLPKEAIVRLPAADASVEIDHGGRNVRYDRAEWRHLAVHPFDASRTRVREEEGPMIQTGGGPELDWGRYTDRVTGASWALVYARGYRGPSRPIQLWIWPGADASAVVAWLETYLAER